MVSHPTQITIGPLTYTVTSDEADYARAVASEKVELYGAINYGAGRITLSPHQSPAHQRGALLHEALHAIIHLTDPSIEEEERLVRTICLPLLDTLRRNPALVAYLTEPDS